MPTPKNLDEWIDLYEKPKAKPDPAVNPRHVLQGPYKQWYIENKGQKTQLDRSIPYATQQAALEALLKGGKPRPADQQDFPEVGESLQELLGRQRFEDREKMMAQKAFGFLSKSEVDFLRNTDPEEDTQHIEDYPEDEEEEEYTSDDLDDNIAQLEERIEMIDQLVLEGNVPSDHVRMQWHMMKLELKEKQKTRVMIDQIEDYGQ